VSRNAPTSPTTNQLSRNLLPLISALWLCVLPFISTAADTLSLWSNASTNSKVWLVEDVRATEAFRPRQENVQEMVRRGITALTGKGTPQEAWLSMISTQDVIGLKVYSRPGADSGTRPAVVSAVAQGLIAAGVPARQIIIWDREMEDLREAGFFDLGEELGVRVAAASKAGWDQTNFYETPLIGNLVFGDLEFERKDESTGRKSFVSKVVSQEMTKIINITPLLNHNTAGVCGNLYSLAMGSVDNSHRFEGDPARLAQAVPELYALPILGDRVVLNITDALICQYEGGQRGLLHYSTVLNQLRFSRDPVALDMLSIKELDRQRRLAKATPVRPNLELYRNAALLELGVSELAKMQIETLR